MAVSKTKCDMALGQRVHDHLVSLGVETPMVQNYRDEIGKRAIIKSAFTNIMEALGLDLEDDSLRDTPNRMAKMYVDEIFAGLNYDYFPKITVVENKAGYKDLLIEKVSAISCCEHHFVPFMTTHNPDKLGCWVAYIPEKKVVGLSKLNRIVEFFCRRPQIQERLVEQIAETMKFILETENVAVVMRSQHFCVMTRGVEDADSYTITNSLHGQFKDPTTRAELMATVNR
jgi:GTP cyclohydrolase I|nr:MAG TPA: GTP cyclohydrolase I [Caudoviricetes sp.]